MSFVCLNRSLQVGAVALALAGMPAGALPADDWPQFRGPGGSGTGAASGLPTAWGPDKNVVWKTELPGPGSSSPIVFGPSIYLTCYTGLESGGSDLSKLTRHLVCVNRADGKVRWTRETPADLPEQAKIREDHGYATSTPAADGERVYVFYGRSGVLALDHAGKLLWQASVGEGLSGWGSAASPVVYKNLVIVNASVESESLVALDRRTGKEAWRARGIREAWNTPLLVSHRGRTELVVPIFEKVLGFDPDAGQQLWECKTQISWYMAPSAVAHDGVVYCIGGRSGGSLAVRIGGRGDVTDTHRVWLGRKGSNVSSPVYHDGHVYWMHDNQGIAYCAEAAGGAIRHQERVAGAAQIYASPVVADGKLFYFDRSGRGFVVAAAPKFELLAKNPPLEERAVVNASPAVADGRLLVRTDRALYCLGTP